MISKVKDQICNDELKFESYLKKYKKVIVVNCILMDLNLIIDIL